jgi:CDP-diacylglycerol--glycerol-3-phosphate 3-phosphatidyltransferase
MNLADRLTLFRIILAPLFFAVYLLSAPFTDKAAWIIPALWVIFVISELTDMFDGMAARHFKQTSDFGKLFDPFADTLMQMTCFLCFVIDGIFPAALFLVVLYREFGILFVRNLMLRKGIAMGARISGKIKTVSYIAAITTALLYTSLARLGIFETVQPLVKTIAVIVFSTSVFFSLLSFFDYIRVYMVSVKDEKNGA